MVNGVAALTDPETCGSEEHCIAVCRDDAIQMEWLPFVGDETRGKWKVELGIVSRSQPASPDYSQYPKPLGCSVEI